MSGTIYLPPDVETGAQRRSICESLAWVDVTPELLSDCLCAVGTGRLMTLRWWPAASPVSTQADIAAARMIVVPDKGVILDGLGIYSHMGVGTFYQHRSQWYRFHLPLWTELCRNREYSWRLWTRINDVLAPGCDELLAHPEEAMAMGQYAGDVTVLQVGEWT